MVIGKRKEASRGEGRRSRSIQRSIVKDKNYHLFYLSVRFLKSQSKYVVWSFQLRARCSLAKQEKEAIFRVGGKEQVPVASK